MMIILSVAGLGNEVKFKLRLPPFLGMCSVDSPENITDQFAKVCDFCFSQIW